MDKKMINCIVGLAVIGAGVVASVLISKKTKKKAMKFADSIMDKTDNII